MEAPFAVSVVDAPKQIGLFDADILTEGIGFTLMVIVAEAVHPAEVPVTV